MMSRTRLSASRRHVSIIQAKRSCGFRRTGPCPTTRCSRPRKIRRRSAATAISPSSDDGIHVRGSGFERHARLQSSDDGEMAVAALLRRILRGREQRVVGHGPVRRNPQLRFAWIIDTWRRDADNRVRLIIEPGCLTDDVGAAAEPLAPQRLADHRDALGAMYFVRGCERPAERRLHLKDVEEIRVDHRGRNALWMIAGRQGDARLANGGKSGEAAIADAPVEEVRRSGVVRWLLRLTIAHADENELVSARERQGPQQGGVHHAENRGVRAAANADRQNRKARETPGRNERAYGGPKVLPKQINHQSSINLKSEI